MKKIFLCLIVWQALSCSNNNRVPRGILPKEKMQQVLWDMLSAGEFLNSYVLNKDSVNKLVQATKVYGQVLQVNHITREQFDKSYAYYRAHPVLMKSILDSLGRRQAPVVLPPPSAPVSSPVIPKPDTLRKTPQQKNLRKRPLKLIRPRERD